MFLPTNFPEEPYFLSALKTPEKKIMPNQMSIYSPSRDIESKSTPIVLEKYIHSSILAWEATITILRKRIKQLNSQRYIKKGDHWFANHEGIYDSLILPQAKLLENRKTDVVKFCRGNDWKGIWLFFPMAVIRDHLFTYDLSGAERKLSEKTRVSFVRQLDSSNLKGSYLTDFITYSYLSDYVNNDIGQFLSSVIELLRSKPKEILE